MSRSALFALALMSLVWRPTGAATTTFNGAIASVFDATKTTTLNAESAGGGGGITFVPTATGADFTDASPVIPYPTPVANDIWHLVLTTDSLHTSSGTPPTGWTKLDEVDVGGATSTSTFWRRATGSEGGSEIWTNIFASGELGRAILTVWRGCTTSGSPFDISGTGSTGVQTAQDIGATTTVANTMLVAIFCADPTDDAVVFTWDGGITEHIDGSATSPSGLAAGWAYITIGSKALASAGAASLGGDLSIGQECAQLFYALKP